VTDTPRATTTPESIPVVHTHIGGQAVLEGVMMRGKYNWAIAVRTPDGSIYTEEHDLKVAERPAWWAKPIARGVVALVDSLTLGMKAFAISAEHSGFEDESGEDVTLSSKEIVLSMVLGVGLAILLFMVLPALATNFLVGSAVDEPFRWNVVDGLMRVVAFFGYIWAISRMKDIQRVFSYHGAEHKTIHAFEHHVPLTPAAIQTYTTRHVRCGTSFLLMVMMIALVVYSLIPVRLIAESLGVEARWAITILAVLIRLIFLPVIAGLAYEVIKWAGKRPEDDPLMRFLLWPGLQLQRMTTREPADDMIEVAVAAVLPIVAREDLEARLARGEVIEPPAEDVPEAAAENPAEDSQIEARVEEPLDGA